MAIRYPNGANTPMKKHAYCLRLKERLRMVHNLMGLWAREGLTQDQYDNGVDSGLVGAPAGLTVVLPPKIKQAFPYVPQLAMAAFRAWSDGPYITGMTGPINGEVSTLREGMAAATAWDADVDLDNVEEP